VGLGYIGPCRNIFSMLSDRAIVSGLTAKSCTWGVLRHKPSHVRDVNKSIYNDAINAKLKMLWYALHSEKNRYVRV
jgi:hypothetical protein